MSFDGVVTCCIVNELKNKLVGGKIQKINQPSKNDLVFDIYSNKKNFKLFISANNNESRINLTEKKFENPISPPNFCMVLRKHLQRSIIKEITQVDLDRIVLIHFSGKDDLGYDKEKSLIVEIMGKYSNIILVENNIIIDSIKRVNYRMSTVRQILPGNTYKLPENNKYNILEENFNEDIFYLNQKLPNNKIPYKIFYENYTGLSPTFGKEMVYLAGIDSRLNWNLVSEDEKEKLNSTFCKFICKIKENNFKPHLFYDGKKCKDFYCFNLNSLNFDKKEFKNMSSAIEEFYEVNKSHDRLRQTKNSLIKILNSNISSILKKINILEENLNKENYAENLKRNADILAANVNMIQKGMDYIKLNNFYEKNKVVKISLDKLKEPWENVNQYYKRYKKIKNSIDFAKKDYPKQILNLEYFEQLKDFIERSESINDLNEIKSEMIENKIIKSNTNYKDKVNKKSEPIHYKTKNGADILIGRNSKQNDFLTLKIANKNDYFFHVKNNPGSHVILKNDNDIVDEDIIIAAFLAANHSSISDEISVEVDYTKKKYVKKPKGAKPGMVYYENFKTINVNPTENLDKNYKLINE